jgi:hypothetical protein
MPKRADGHDLNILKVEDGVLNCPAILVKCGSTMNKTGVSSNLFEIAAIPHPRLRLCTGG